MKNAHIETQIEKGQEIKKEQIIRNIKRSSDHIIGEPERLIGTGQNQCLKRQWLRMFQYQ